MQFTLSTKPFADALNLSVINANISKFYQKSLLAQLTADSHTLTINLEAANICTQVILKGSGDQEGTVSIFVDCAYLKAIVGTFETSVTTLEFEDNALILHSGSSKFTLAKLVDASEGSLAKPSLADPSSSSVKLVQADWKFIDEHQMFALATSFMHPVYTNVWIGNEGDVIVGDFDQSMFTFSKKGKLGKSCLLTQTIINLFTSLPDGAELTQVGDSYRIDLKTDGFEYAAELTPKYESDPGVGSYSAETISAPAVKNEDNCIKVPVAPIQKLLSQASLISSSADSTLHFSLESSVLHIWNTSTDFNTKVEGNCADFFINFNFDLFKSCVSNIDAETVKISPLFGEEGTKSADGVMMWTENMSICLGGQEDQ